MKKLILFAAIAALTASPAFAMKEGPRNPAIPQKSDISQYAGYMNKAQAKYDVSSPAVRLLADPDMVIMRAQIPVINNAATTGSTAGYVQAKINFDTAFQRACSAMGDC